MSVAIRIDVDGVEAMNQRLQGWSRRMDDWRPIWRDVATDFRRTTRAMFAGEGRVDDLDRWRPLSRAYAAQKARTHPGRGILVRTGRLRREASHPRTRATPDELTLTIQTPYAGYHQRGTRRMPARPVIRLAKNRAQQDRIVNIVESHLQP